MRGGQQRAVTSFVAVGVRMLHGGVARAGPRRDTRRMRINNPPESAPTVPPSFIVEVEGYEGEDGQILVDNYRANGTPKFGSPDKIYCIAAMDADGVIRINDWGATRRPRKRLRR